MKHFLHFTLIFIIVAAFPLDGYTQRLPAKIKISNTLKNSQIGQRPIPVDITTINEYVHKSGASQVEQAIIQRIPKVHVRRILIDTTVLAKLNQQSIRIRIAEIGISIDTTIFTKVNQRERMNRIIEMSKERVEASRSDWLSFDISKDLSLMYKIYRFEQARFQMLMMIALNSEHTASTGESLKMMESIYNREVIVLPNVEIDVPRSIELTKKGD